MDEDVELSGLFLNALPKRFLSLDPDCVARVHENIDYAIFLPVRPDTYVRAQLILNNLRRMEQKQFGFRGWRIVAYFWFVSWRALALGVSVHLWRPCNVEIHMPFGFFRFGLTDLNDRVAQYEEWLCHYIVQRYNDGA